VLAAEHLLGFAGVNLQGQLVESPTEIGRDGLSGFGPFDQHLQVVELPLQRIAQLDVLLEAAAALLDFLRVRLVLPEVRSADEFFYLGEFNRGASGVKDSSAGRWRGAPNPRTCEAVRPGAWEVMLNVEC
jgi:hypothetical protein